MFNIYLSKGNVMNEVRCCSNVCSSKEWKKGESESWNFFFKFISYFLLGLVSEQTSKMAETWKAVCIWSRSPRAWHGLPVVTPGAVFPQQFVPGNVSHGPRTWQYPRHLLLVLPSVSPFITVLSPRSSGCSTSPMPRPSRMSVFM